MPLPDDLNIQRLCDDIRKSRQVLQFNREQRREMVRQRCGIHYAENGAAQKVPVNFIALYETIISRGLIANNPRVMLSTFRREHKPAVAAMQSWRNKENERTHLQEVLHRAVVDALYSIGIVQVGIADPGMAAVTSWNLKAGDAFVQVIDLDDWFYETAAHDFQHGGFEGNRYQVPMRAIKNSELYQYRDHLEPSSKSSYNDGGDERIGAIGEGTTSALGDDGFEDMVDLWQVYLPRHRLVLTLKDNGGVPSGCGPDHQPLRVQQWIGPDNGPYFHLGFGLIPGNAMPAAPIPTFIYDLHLTGNETFRKLERQAQRLKQLSLVTGGNVEDGKRIKDAADGDMPLVSRADSVVPLIGAGPNQQLFAFFEAVRNFISWFGGNLDSIGGLSAQSKTATQDQLLSASSGKTVQAMQDAVVAFTSKVLKACLWFDHHHPTKRMHTATEIQGLPGGSIPGVVNPAGGGGMNRDFRFEDMDIRVDPYSLPAQTPQGRLQQMNEVVTQIVIPMMQLLQAQGVNFDINAYLVKVGQYLDMPDLAEILTIIEPPMEDTASPPDKPPMPQTTERRYVRENLPGRTQQGDSMNRINTLMGIDTGGNPEKNGHPVGA